MSEYRALKGSKVIATAQRLERRVRERFPDASLAQVAAEVAQVAREAETTVEEIDRPIYWPRALVALFVILLLGTLVAAGFNLELSEDVFRIDEFLPLAEAALNDLVLLGAALFFLLSVETRVKRRRALRALDELRALAHVVDMHQLTKDPERLLHRGPPTASSPEPRFASAFELGRYLDYCSELLSILGKIAALYAQTLDDAVLLETVNEIETLSTGLSRKVWQKIMILEGRRGFDPEGWEGAGSVDGNARSTLVDET
ncbi:MAG: hypothetical protein AAGD01_16710 [Acidobacteriota bacterium]